MKSREPRYLAKAAEFSKTRQVAHVRRHLRTAGRNRPVRYHAKDFMLVKLSHAGR